jgi:hypothetical protein
MLAPDGVMIPTSPRRSKIFPFAAALFSAGLLTGCGSAVESLRPVAPAAMPGDTLQVQTVAPEAVTAPAATAPTAKTTTPAL